jgi:hypothetical protein
MKHSGLQKSISSIFDGTEPLKQETTPTASQNPVAVAVSKPQPVIPTASHAAVAATLQSPPSSVPGAASPLTKSATRPRPVLKKKTTPHHTFFIGNLWTTIKFKVLGDSKKGADPRQKKALILVVGLVVVLVIVLRFALGSGMSGAKAALKKTGTTEASSSNSQSANIENWQKPEIYPLSLRDPMKPSSNASTSNGLFEGEVTVRGIVYSSDKPSAIIADQIVSEGDIILGVKILKIGKDFVAFEKDGKRWQQQVRQ